MPHQEHTKCIEQGYLKSLKDGARVIVRKVLEDFDHSGWQRGQEEAVAAEYEFLHLNMVFSHSRRNLIFFLLCVDVRVLHEF